MAPPAVREIPGPDGWQVRIVPNKYPAVSPLQDDGNLQQQDGNGPLTRDGNAAGASAAEEPPMFMGGADSLFQRLPARGLHEVVVETPEHHRHPADMEPSRWAAVLAAWRDRCRELGQTPQWRFLALFRNHGSVAGASQPHPHSQLMALAHVPPAQRRRWEHQQAYYAATGRCLLCDVLDAEQTAGQRLVFADPHFIAFCPFAPVFPYEVWIAPRRHVPLFHHLSDDELLPLAHLLVRVWGALRALGDPPHNLVVHSGPPQAVAPFPTHWYIQIAPRISPLAGFEVGTGMTIVSVAPEQAARALREAIQGGNGRHLAKK